jgi:hypothetical protein
VFSFKIMGRPKKTDAEKVSKPGVALDPECRDIIARIIAYEMKVRGSDMTPSQAIRTCIRQAWRLLFKDLEEGKAQTVVGVVIRPASESSVSGPSTRMKKNSPKAS